MSKLDKLIKKIFAGQQVSYEEAESLLRSLGFGMEACGSHHVFRKKGYKKNISIKRRSQLFPYQLKDIREVLEDHGFSKTN